MRKFKFFVMLPTNQAGETITPENVFHRLITRLVKLKNGLKRAYEIENNYKEVIEEIEENIFGYSPDLIFPLIVRSENLIQEIIESNVDFYRNIDIKYGYENNDVTDMPEVVKEELEYYSDNIVKLKKHFEDMEQELGFTDTNTEKITINISVPKLSWLAYFLTQDLGNTDSGELSKILNADHSSSCRQFIKIFKKANGEDIAFQSLRNKRTSPDSFCSSLKYWQDVFGKYRQICAELIHENGCT
jgi:hypothetical protein